MNTNTIKAHIEIPEREKALLEVKNGILTEMILGDQLYRIYSTAKEKEFRQLRNNTEGANNKLHLAKVALHNLYAEHFVPVFTVPRSFINEILKSGLTPRLTYIPGLKLLAGTIGIKYYDPAEEDPRFLAIIKNMDQGLTKQIQPRFTGATIAFRGIVASEKTVPLEKLIIIDSSSMKIIYPENIETEVLDEDKLVKETRTEIRNIVG